MNKVFVCGDTHNTLDTKKIAQFYSRQGRYLTKDDYLIIVGDFGVLWENEEDSRERQLLGWYQNLPWTTLFIDGNHENFERLKALPQEPMFGRLVGKVRNGVYHLHRGHVYTIADKTFFTFGGGDSIDKQNRIPYVSWWPDEMPTYAEFQHGLDCLHFFNNKVDFIITHTCSHSVFNKLSEHGNLDPKRSLEEKPLRNYFEHIDGLVEGNPPWYFGHFHMDVDIDERYHCLYNGQPIRII